MRVCGDCTACCTVLEIGALAKPAGVSCHNLCASGCRIYDQRPENPCQTFRCAWLQGFLDEEDRPDKSGGIVWQVNEDGNTITIISELPGQKVSSKVFKWVNKISPHFRVESPPAEGD